jgi:hypothetical protein
MQIVEMNIDDIIPYDKNPRDNDSGVGVVANSIKEFGFKVPIVVDKNNIIINGHTRLKASRKLGLDKIPVIVANDLSPEKANALRLVDNKTSEFSSWNDLLNSELEDLQKYFDMTDFGFDPIEGLDNEDEEYTKVVNIPQYQVGGVHPELVDLVNGDKVADLISEIEESNLNEDEKEFLKKAAYRHYVFDYRNIAEYYANAPKKMQELMERSALIIIDYEDAVMNGYVNLSKDLQEMSDEDENYE